MASRRVATAAALLMVTVAAVTAADEARQLPDNSVVGAGEGEDSGKETLRVLPLSSLSWAQGNLIVNPFQNAMDKAEIAAVSHRQMVEAMRHPYNTGEMPQPAPPVVFGPTGQSGNPLRGAPGLGYV